LEQPLQRQDVDGNALLLCSGNFGYLERTTAVAGQTGQIVRFGRQSHYLRAEALIGAVTVYTNAERRGMSADTVLLLIILILLPSLWIEEKTPRTSCPAFS
jgi:hypothetical protein